MVFSRRPRAAAVTAVVARTSQVCRDTILQELLTLAEELEETQQLDKVDLELLSLAMQAQHKKPSEEQLFHQVVITTTHFFHQVHLLLAKH